MWVKLYNAIGSPLFLDEPTFSRNRFTFGRICVDVLANKKISKQIKTNLGYGKPFDIRFETTLEPAKMFKLRDF